MKCVIRKTGETTKKTTTITLERDETVAVFKEVPADVCDNCGEAYLSQETSRRLLKILDEIAESGVQVEVRQYSAASA